ncbi:MAG: hypothetical protein WCT33_02855 [Patescibacteria group bacterium]|jgi:hypothetical protein
MSRKPKSSAQIYERRDTRDDILCSADAAGFTATKKGGRIKITNRGQKLIIIAARRRAVLPGRVAFVARDIPLKVGGRTFVCR